MLLGFDGRRGRGRLLSSVGTKNNDGTGGRLRRMELVGVDVNVALAFHVRRLGTKTSRDPIGKEHGRGSRSSRHFGIVMRILVLIVNGATSATSAAAVESRNADFRRQWRWLGLFRPPPADDVSDENKYDEEKDEEDDDEGGNARDKDVIAETHLLVLTILFNPGSGRGRGFSSANALLRRHDEERLG